MLGRATLLLLISQGVLMVSGYTVNVGLARLLGPEDFGQFGVVMSFLLVIQVFVITGIPIALQKYVAENTAASRVLLRKTLPWHLFYSAAVFAGFFLTAPLLAWLYEDMSLRFYLQIAAIDILSYGLYKYFLSMQNGMHEFGRQAAMGIAYGLCKPLAIFALVLMGYGVTGAVLGNMLGSVGGLLVGLLILRFPELRKKLDDIPFFQFAFTNVFYYVGLQLLMSIDIWFVKYYLSGEATGQYVSASRVAQIPYLLSLAVSSALMPSISRATKANDEKRVRDIVRIFMRYWLILLFAMIVVVDSTASSLIVLFFGDKYQAAAPVLALLFAAVALLTLAAVMNTILISRDRLVPCLKIIGFLIGAHVVANFLLVPKFGGLGAAGATLIVAVLANARSGYLLLKETGVVLPPASMVRTIIASVLVFAAANLFPVSQHFVVVKCVALLGLFVAVLFALRELNIADIKRLRAIVV